MAQPIKVLLVDDKEDYCMSLSGPARHKNIQIVYNLDWETGFETLKNDPNIEFVILDGKGKIEADQETEKDNFVMRAMKDIDEYSQKQGKDIPYCVNTGFMERFEALEGNVKIFEKNNEDRDLMFQYIIDEVEMSEYRTLRMEFNEPFKPFDIGIIDKTYEYLLIDILKTFRDKDYREKNLNVQRKLLEAIYISLHDPIPCIPLTLFKESGKPILAWCTKFMEDKHTLDGNGKSHKINKNIPEVIKSSFRKLVDSTNGYSHVSEEPIAKYPFLANTFLIMEILVWLSEFIEEHYEYYI